MTDDVTKFINAMDFHSLEAGKMLKDEKEIFSLPQNFLCNPYIYLENSCSKRSCTITRGASMKVHKVRKYFGASGREGRETFIPMISCQYESWFFIGEAKVAVKVAKTKILHESFSERWNSKRPLAKLDEQTFNFLCKALVFCSY